MQQQFWWVIWPYLTLVIMICGLIARYLYRQMGWGSKSSELLEKRLLRPGIYLLHYGIIFAFIGHVMGLLVPMQLYDAMGISPELYHFNSKLFGGIAGLAAWLGGVILLIRRLFNTRVRKNSSPSDWIALLSFLIVVTLGDSVTLFVQNYEYRATVGPWVRGLLSLRPNSSLMLGAPLILQVHIVAAFGFFAIIPFTRLVHMFSLPIRYLVRAPIQYRARMQYRYRMARD